jgi:hypothetical protein
VSLSAAKNSYRCPVFEFIFLYTLRILPVSPMCILHLGFHNLYYSFDKCIKNIRIPNEIKLLEVHFLKNKMTMLQEFENCFKDFDESLNEVFEICDNLQTIIFFKLLWKNSVFKTISVQNIHFWTCSSIGWSIDFHILNHNALNMMWTPISCPKNSVTWSSFHAATQF